MKKFWIFIMFLLFFPVLASAVQINEIMYDLPGADSDREWIELFQESDSCIDLEGWKFYEAETNHRLNSYQGEMTLCAGDFTVIVDKPEKFLEDHPGFSGNLIDSSFSLSNTGETLALKNPDGEIVNSVTYSSSSGAKGNGKSLERNSTGWFESLSNSTPGAQNSIIISQQEGQQQEEQEQQTQTYTPPANYSPLIDFHILARSNHVPPGSAIETVVSVSSNYLVERTVTLCSVIVNESGCRSVTLGPDGSREVRLYNSLEPETTGNLTLTVELREGAAVKKKSTWLEVLSPTLEERAEPAEEERGPTGALVVEVDEKDFISRIVSAIKEFLSSLGL